MSWRAGLERRTPKVLSHFESAGPLEQSLATDSCHCPQRLHL